jgi:hypothetical protein
MIEYGKKSEEDLNYDEAFMFCFWHEPVGTWRLPTEQEYFQKMRLKYPSSIMPTWYEDRDQLAEKIHQQPAKMRVVPVRSL